ncbi:adenylyl-sulfate kinase [Paenibacillus hamazuiensis]|uniref:adenylyl-sulfate kinase n=1 Tax=Paenibacillus hamazuiensis TaxID=2936508 RepID=UPI00200F6FFA|nr:adenylyl-sulfate kinase [Paenibacillus hamazuiensis]
MDKREGNVLWFTGLSGAGKTTTAREVYGYMVRLGRGVELLDGDELRARVCKGLGFDREGRMENIRRIGYIASLLSRHGVDVIVSAITPYREMRNYLRTLLPGYVEIYAQCSLAECEKRDVKGLYAKARRQEIGHFTGISDPYEEPERPDLIIDTENRPLAENAGAIIEWLRGRNRL